MSKGLGVFSTAVGAAVVSALVTVAPANAYEEPTLGQVWASNQEGYGAVRPARVSNGGDPTGIVDNITWSAWGGAQATGSGTGYWHGPDASVAESAPTPATIVAWNLGRCDDRQAYRAVNWYFPTKGETLDMNSYINICTGDYVN